MRKKNKLVFGIGINDLDYPTKQYEIINGKWKIVWDCPYYVKWKSMLMRCYSKKYQERQPTYKGCSVCEEWLLFSSFKSWMEEQEWEDRQLDKDFLVEGNKVYSPSTCVYLPSKLNNFITTSGKIRGRYPLGVSYKKKGKDMVNELNNPYVSKISDQAVNKIHLGYYSTQKEAHQVYLKAKLEQCEDYLIEFKDERLIMKGLTRIYNKIQYHIENNLELTSF